MDKTDPMSSMPCRKCGGVVEPGREIYAIPICHACLSRPKNTQAARRAAARAEGDTVIDDAAPRPRRCPRCDADTKEYETGLIVCTDCGWDDGMDDATAPCRQCAEYVEILFNLTVRAEKAERERDEARAVADRLLRSLMAAARGEPPPADGIDCDEVRTIGTLRRERDEARAQLAALRPKWSNEPPRREGWYWEFIPEIGVGVLHISECPADYVGYPGQKWAGPLRKPEETP